MADAAPDQVLGAIDRTRETAKWLIASFAAVGAVLAAGIQVSGLGGVSGTHLAVAIGGAVLGFAGVLVAIFSVARVLTPAEINFDDLKGPDVEAFIARNPDALAGRAATVEELLSRYQTALKHAADVDQRLWDAPDNADANAEAERAHAVKDVLRSRVEFLRKWALYRRVRETAQEARSGVAVGVGYAVIGLLMFAWGANPGTAGGQTASGDASTPVGCQTTAQCPLTGVGSSQPLPNGTVSGLVDSIGLTKTQELLRTLAAPVLAGASDTRRHILNTLIDNLGSIVETTASDTIDAVFNRLLAPEVATPVAPGAAQRLTIVIYVHGDRVRVVRVPVDNPDG